MSAPSPVATFSAPKLTDAASVLEFRGSEALGRPYRFDIHLRVSGEAARNIDEQAAIGTAATLRLQRGTERAPFAFQGVLREVAVLLETTAWALYKVSLVPRIWQLGLTRHSRVFTKMAVPDILAEVLESAGLSQGSDFEMRLQGDYPTEELVTMYGESKLSFLHRWMEREGIVYFFEHDTADGGIDKLILSDHPSAHAALADESVPYRPLADDDTSAGACFDTFAMLRNAVVGAVKLSDYDYARPALDLSAEQAVSDQGFGHVVEHMGRFFDPAQAKRYAQLRAEAIQSREVTYHVAGSALHLSAGWLMEVAEHARDAFNARYLVHEVQHMGNQLGDDLPPKLKQLIAPLTEHVYRAEARAVASDTPFRPQQTTAWPRVSGYENAIVDGPAESDYAQIDDQGRYLVQMHFDESELEDGKRSTYVRMMQPHGGRTEGFHFPLRKGTEVKLGFDEGDPDRPFIAGVVPNTTTPSPVTQANHTQNVIATGGGNLIAIEDEEDKQQFYFYSPVGETQMWMGDKKYVDADANLSEAQKDELLYAFNGANVGLASKGSAAFWFGGDWWSNTGGVRVDIVKGDVTEFYLANHSLHVSSDQKVGVSGLRMDQVDSGVQEKFGSFHATTVSGWRSEKAGDVSENYDTQTTKVAGPLNYSASSTTMSFADTNLNFGATEIHWGSTTGNITDVNMMVPGGITLNVPGGVNITTPSWNVTDPTQSWLGAQVDSYAGMKTSITGFSASATGIGLTVTGASIGRTGVSLPTTVAQIAKLGLDLSSGGPFIKDCAFMVRAAGVHLLM